MILKKIIIIILVVILGSAAIFGITKFAEEKECNNELENVTRFNEEIDKEKKEFNNKLEDIISFQAYILPEYENNTEEIANKIKKIKGIKNVDFVSKDEAFEQMKDEMGEDALKGLDNTIFPCAFIIYCEINDLERTYFEEIKKKIMDIEGIQDVSSNYISILKIYNEKGEDVLEKIINDPDNWKEYID